MWSVSQCYQPHCESTVSLLKVDQSCHPQSTGCMLQRGRLLWWCPPQTPAESQQGFKYSWIRHARLVSKGYTWGMVSKGSSSKTNLSSTLACLFTLLAWQLKQQVQKQDKTKIKKSTTRAFGDGLDFSMLLRQKEPCSFDATLSITSCAASLQRS